MCLCSWSFSKQLFQSAIIYRFCCEFSHVWQWTSGSSICECVSVGMCGCQPQPKIELPTYDWVIWGTLNLCSFTWCCSVFETAYGSAQPLWQSKLPRGLELVLVCVLCSLLSVCMCSSSTFFRYLSPRASLKPRKTVATEIHFGFRPCVRKDALYTHRWIL